jgi:nitrate/nitrite-specific signal transduction histidine kinase
MSIKHRVILSILAIFIVILGMFIATWMVTASQKTDSLVINLAGRQRMLMQMMTKQTLAHVLAVQKGAAEQGLKDAVQRTKAVFEATHNALQNSGQAPLTLDPAGPNGFLPAPSAAVRDQLAQVQRLWTNYAKSIAAVLCGQGVGMGGGHQVRTGHGVYGNHALSQTVVDRTYHGSG